MNFPRRTFLSLALGTGALSAVPRVARAQAYPSRPVRMTITAERSAPAKPMPFPQPW